MRQRAAQQVSALTGGTLDYLIHNAARMDPETLYKGFDSLYAPFPLFLTLASNRTRRWHRSESMEALDADFIDAFRINTLGVIHSIQAFLPLLRAAPAGARTIVVLGTEGGIPERVRAARIADMAAYGVTKGGALVAAAKFALTLAPERFTVVTVSPGLVDTAATMPGGAYGAAAQAALDGVLAGFAVGGVKPRPRTPKESVELQLKAIDGLTTEQNGLFLAPTRPQA